MKLLAFTDLHGEAKIIKKLLAKIQTEKPDVIVCSGDISSFGSNLKNILKKFSLGIPFLIIPGNHEMPEEIEVYIKDMEHIKNIHLQSFVMDNVLFIGCGGGGFTPQHAEFEQSEKYFEDSIKKLSPKGNQKKVVLITHQPPYKTKLDYIMGDSSGSKSIRKFIEKHQPDYCLVGHIHENFGKKDKIGKTIVINPAPEGIILNL